MKIAYNPITEAALTSAPLNNDITFDLKGVAIYARGVKFKGTDTNNYRPISVNGTSILGNNNTALNLIAGTNINITNSGGNVTIASPNSTTLNLAIPYIVGPSTDTVGTWTGSYSGITAYTDGLTIIYVPGVNGSSTTTLNINGLGAKTCYWSNANKLTTHYSVGTPILLTYVGGSWKRADYNSDSNTYTSAWCGTAAATAAKTASCSNYTLKANSYIHILIRYANTAKNAITLNINSTGAKSIYINGSASSASNYTLPAGTYIVYYDGTNFYFRTDGILPGTIEKASSATLSNKVANNLILKIKSGTTEGTDLYTYNGSAAKTLDIKQGTGIALTAAANALTITNSGVRSIATGTTNGTISVNTNGTSTNVAVKGLGDRAFDSTKYLPLTGGTITSTSNAPLSLISNTDYSTIRFKTGEHYRYFGINSKGNLFVTPDSAWDNEYAIWHSGNDGPSSGLDADLLDGKHLSDILKSNVSSATKLQTARKLWGQSFDGTADVNGDITINATGNKDYFINFLYDSTPTCSWRLGYLGSGSGNANYFVIDSSKSSGGTWHRALQIGNETLNATFGGTVIAPTFQGNLDGTYINKLTGYTKATSASNIATTDTLNAALGKLEYKAGTAYDWYKSVTGTDNDDIINKWEEIVDFIDSVKEGTDITDEFVTRKTALDITGLKTFKNIIFGNYYNSNENKPGAYLILNKGGNYLGIGSSSTNVNNIVIGESDFNGNWIKELLTITTAGNVTATKFIKSGGTSSQFLKADGSVDSTTYATASSLGNYLPLTGGKLNSGTDTPLVILGKDHSWIEFKNSNNSNLGWIGVLSSKLPSFFSDKSYKIWHEGNDGAGSGLDADLLDGKHASAFALISDLNNYVTLNTTLTITGAKTFSTVVNIKGTNQFSEGIRLHHYSGLSSLWFGAVNNSGYDPGMWGISVDSNGMRFRGTNSTTGTSASDYVNIIHGGNVGIGTTSPTQKLHVNGNILATKFITSGGTSSQFVKGDGSLDSTSYIHSGNIGSQSVKSAQYLVRLEQATDDDFASYVSEYITGKGVNTWTNSSGASIGSVINTGTVLNVGSSKSRFFRLISVKAGNLYYQTPNNSNDAWNTRRTIVDSENYESIVTNVASATKLQTARTLWGQPFDGTANVSGNMTGVGSITATGNYSTSASDASDRAVTVLNTNGKVGLYVYTSRGLYDFTKNKWLIGTQGTNTFLLLGNVGIGNTTPAYNLDVTGTGRFTKSLTLSGTASADAALIFSRTESYNYIVFPGNVATSTLAFGYDRSHAGTYYIMNSTALYPAVDNKFNLGINATARWKNVYAVTFRGDLDGNAATASKLGTSTLGGTYQPIYLSSGTATAGTSYAKAIKGITRSGTTFTYTCIDGTTGTFSQQDTVGTSYASSKSAKTAATAGWYRVATTVAGVNRVTGIFQIEGTVSGSHSICNLISGISYGNSAGAGVSVLSCHHHTGKSLTKARIVYHTTYSGNYAYLEVYLSAAKATTINVKLIDGTGWTLVSPNTAGSIPEGYSNKEVQLTDDSITTTGNLYLGGSLNISTLNIPTSSGGTTLGPGSSGQVLKSNGTTVYWATDNNSNTWRAIQANGTQIASTGTGTYALNFVSGTGITVAGTAGTSSAANKITITNAGVRSATINGNYLRVNTNGTNADLTIPYASLAGTLAYADLPSTRAIASGTGWCKFATLTYNSKAWDRVLGYLFVAGIESNHSLGILYYQFRSGSTATEQSTWVLNWLVKNKDVVLVIAVKTADNVMDLYISNSGTYESIRLYHMSDMSGKFDWNVGTWETTKPTATYEASLVGRVNHAVTADSVAWEDVTGRPTITNYYWANQKITSSASYVTPSFTGVNIYESSKGTNRISMNWDSTTGSASSVARIYAIENTGSGYRDLSIGKTSGALYYDASADLWGVGTTTPSYKLHISGSLGATGAASLGSTLSVAGATTLGGAIRVKNSASNPYIYFQDSSVGNTMGGIFDIINITNNAYTNSRFLFRQFSYTSGTTTGSNYYENYFLPETAADLTANATYYILTTKNTAVSGDGGSTWGSSITVKINGTSRTLTIPANPNTDTKITQTNSTNNAEYRVLFSETADDTTRTEGARKSTNLKFNPSTGTLTATKYLTGSSSFSNGAIELSGGTPFIDFHYNNSTDDYTSRIIEGLSGQLTVTGKLRVGLGYTTSTDYNFYVNGTSFTKSLNVNDKLSINTSGLLAPSSTANRSAGMYGVYDSTKVGHVWSMGTSYKITDDGSNTGSMYGLIYFHPNWSNTDKNDESKTDRMSYAGNHLIGLVTNGRIDASLGYYIWSRNGFLKAGSSDSYILLGGGGHKALSTLTTSWTGPDATTAKIGTLTIGGTANTLYDLFIQNLGNTLANNTDLNTIKTPSIYRSSSSAASATMTNAPWKDSGFRLITLTGYGGNTYSPQLAAASLQFFWRILGSSNNSPTDWYSWIKFKYGTAVGSSSQPIYIDAEGYLKPCDSLDSKYLNSTYSEERTNVPATWLKIARFYGGYFNYTVYIVGGWWSMSPSIAKIHIFMRNGSAYITLLSGLTGLINSTIRLGKIDTNTWELLVYQPATTSTISALYYYFVGNTTGTLALSKPCVESTTTYSETVDLDISTITGTNITTSNYGSYLGYIGTTAVLPSSAALALTGITTLTTSSNISIGGKATITKELTNKDLRFNYGLAYYNTTTSTVTGTIVITLPNGWNNSMNTYEIDIYEYKGYDGDADDILHSKIILDGYNYGSGPYWKNYGYTQIGSYNKGVRLGYNGSKCVIMLGTTSTTWKYPQIHLSRVITGYDNQTAWSSGYSISVITDESSYSGIVTANRLRQRFDDVVANNFRGNLVGTASLVANTLTFAAGTFAAGTFETYNGSAAVTVNIPTSKSHVGLGNVQNTAFYKRVTTINGTGWNMAGTSNEAAFTIYAPTTAGTSGYVLKSNGSGAPTWLAQSSIAAGSAAYVPVTSITAETEINQTGLRAYSGSGSSWTGEVTSMAYAGIIAMGSPSRGLQIWARRGTGTTGNLRFRVGNTDATAWETERVILDNVNSSVSLSGQTLTVKINGVEKSLTNTTGYVGTTAVLSSSATQALTGISSITSTSRLTLNAVDTALDLKFNNDNTKSVLLNGSSFKPFNSANGKLSLGSSSARWTTVYALGGNFSGTVISNAEHTHRLLLRYGGTAGTYADLQISTRGTACTTEGTAGTTGVTYLLLGNSTAVSTTAGSGAENAVGVLRLYGSSSGYTNIRCGTNNGSGYTLYLPGANGQFVYHDNDTAVGNATTPVYVTSGGKITACTSYTDVLGNYLPLSGGTIDGSLTIVNGHLVAPHLRFSIDGTEKILTPYAAFNNDLSYYDGSSWYRVIHSGNIGSQSVAYATSAGNAAALGGKSLSNGNYTFNSVPYIKSDGVMEVGKYIDFHNDNTTGNDYDCRLDIQGAHKNTVHLPTTSGVLALTTSNVASATNADMVDGYHASYSNAKPWGTIPVITTSGWMDIGKQLEFHYDNTTGSDYSTALRCAGNYSNNVYLPSNSGTLALTSDIPTSLPANGGNADTVDGYHIAVQSSAGTDTSTIYFVI